MATEEGGGLLKLCPGDREGSIELAGACEVDAEGEREDDGEGEGKSAFESESSKMSHGVEYQQPDSQGGRRRKT